MKRETKFNYGFLFVGLGLPLLADYFLGRKWGVIAAIVVTVVGALLLISGHQHHEKDEPPPQRSKLSRAGIYILVGVLLSGGAWCVMHVFSSSGPTSDNERAVFFDSMNDFISKKDESELRETFDIPTVTRDAILEAKIQLTPAFATQAERDMLARDTVDGQNIFYFRYVHVNGNNITPLPGKSGILHLTPKAIKARKQLTMFYSSALTPLEVSNALKDLEKAILDNQELLMDTINESYAANPSTISNAFSCPKQDCLTVNNLFYPRFIQLQPKATAITAAMRKYMESYK